jgi:enediyne biosynthesis protein E4
LRCTRRLAACGLAVAAIARAQGPATSPAPAAAPSFDFVSVGAEVGVTEPTWCGRPEKPHILESGGTGLALVDVDADGDLDLYVVDGWRLEGAAVVERGRNRLYRNRGDGTFEDFTDASGTGDEGWGTGVAVGDADGDGRADLFVSNFGPDALFLNRGGGRFERAPRPPGIDGWSTGAAFFDADGDGDEDLYVAGYIECTQDDVLGARPELDWEGQKVMLGPFGLEGEGNRYFVNGGGGRFHDATQDSGLTDVGLYYSFGVAALDLDGDLDVDLYVANDSNPNYLYSNDGLGHFQEVGLWSGAALDGGGSAQAGMGLAPGDFDQDGRPDLLVTNFHTDASTLYHNLGDLLFEDVTPAVGLHDPTFAPLSWGTVLADFDLDGTQELFVANGHIYPQADRVPNLPLGYRQRNLLLTDPGGGFVDVSDQAGPGLEVAESSRGVAAGDLDGDGDLDLVLTNCDAAPTILRNDTPHRGAWLLVDAPGALKVTVEAGGRTFVRHGFAGGSFLSAHDPRFHFGLGPVATVERVTALWPDGSESVRLEVGVDQVFGIEPDAPRQGPGS